MKKYMDKDTATKILSKLDEEWECMGDECPLSEDEDCTNYDNHCPIRKAIRYFTMGIAT